MKNSERKSERKRLIAEQPTSSERQAKLIDEFVQEVVMAPEYFDVAETRESGPSQPQQNDTNSAGVRLKAQRGRRRV
jgi:hypothetical protein